MKDIFITASELGDFCYCRWCWWRYLHGEPKSYSENLDAGAQMHEKVASQTQQYASTASSLFALVYIGLFIAGLFFIMGLCLYMLTG